MDELKLPLVYNGEELELPLKMYGYGFTFRIEVLIGNTAVIFEPDEEGCYRALVNTGDLEKNKIISENFLQAIADSLEKLR